VSVTDDGAAYYERCLQILADVRDADDAVAGSRASPAGRLRVDAPTGLASEVIIPALPGFFAAYPDIRLELGCSDRPVDLVEEGVDCAIRGGRRLRDSRLVARRVGTMQYVTCAAPAYLARFGRPVHPDDLADHHCVNYFSVRNGRMFDWYFARGAERVQVGLSSHLAVSDSYAYVAAGLAGLGIVQMADFLMAPMIEDGRLVRILDGWSNEPLPVHVVYPENRHLSAKVRVFLDWVAELFAQHASLR